MRRSAALALLIVAAVACQQKGKKVIAIVPKATSHIFWVQVERGVRAAEKDLGVEVLWNGAASETDYGRQIQIVDSMISRHVDAIGVAATERKILTKSLDRAAAAKIPVLIFDSGVEGDNYLSFLSTNNYEGGVLGARELGRLLSGKGKVALMAHQPGSASTGERELGFEETLAKEFPGMSIVARQFSMSDRAKGRAAAENMLTAHADLGGIFCSAEPGSMGTALAIKSRGLSGKVKLIAFDSSEPIIDDLKGGTIAAMVVQDPFHMGYDTVRTLVDYLNGTVPPKRIDLAPRLIRKEDLDKPDVKKLLQ